MSTQHRALLAALALCSLPVSFGAAQAAGTSYEAYSSLTNLQFALTDLRPDDGIAATVSFDDSGVAALVGGSVFVVDNVHGTSSGQFQQSRDFGEVSPFGAQAHVENLQPDNTYAGAFLEGNSIAATARLTQIGQYLYSGASLGALNYDLDSGDLPALIQNTMILAPHTQITISGQAKYGLVRLGEGHCDGCSLVVEARSLMLGSDAFEPYYRQADPMFDQVDRIEGLYDSFGIKETFDQGLADGQGAVKMLSLTLTNDSDEAKSFGFLAGTYVLAQTASAVPEPETWGLALGGLLMVGAASRRRQR